MGPLCALALAIAAPARAHPLSLSGFDIYAEDPALRIEFKLDAKPVLDLVNRWPGVPLQGIAQLRTRRQDVLAYVRSHFSVANDNTPCRAEWPDDFLVHETAAKVLLNARFVCDRPLDLVSVASTLFAEDASVPDLLCNFYYRRALEHYFFGKGVSLAQIPVRKLAQTLPADLSNTHGDRPQPPAGAYDASTPAQPVGLGGSRFVRFLGQGVHHILAGLDHVLFVVTLLIAVRGRRELILIVTSFTLAHSLTLVLGTLDLVTASPRLVEPLIALSIVYVALENLLRRSGGELARRPAVTFGFGLVHGLGFSAALRDLGLPARQLFGPLIGFNLGVELGQLAIVLPLLPLVLWLRRRDRVFTRVHLAVNVAVALLAAAWFVERVAG